MSRLKMQDKNLKKHMAVMILVTVIGVLLANIVVNHFLRKIEKQNNEALTVLLGNVKLYYPDIAEEEWIAMLNEADGYTLVRGLLERCGM